MAFTPTRKNKERFTSSVEAQKPIRILNSIRMPPEWEARIVKSKFKDFPTPADVRTHYEGMSIGFDLPPRSMS